MTRRQDRRDSPLRPSPEPLETRLALDASSVSYVAAVYQTVLHRAATSQEVSYWTQQIKGGQPAYNLASGLVNSPERRTAEIAVDYQTLLHRNPGPGETSSYLAAFANGARSDDVLQSFLSSPEYRALHPGNTAYVDALYNDILGRDADASGEAFYVNLLNQGASPMSVVAGFLYSPEREGQVVDQVYASVLRRADNPVEHQAQIDLLVFGGNHTENLIVGALTSPEFLKHHNGTTA